MPAKKRGRPPIPSSRDSEPPPSIPTYLKTRKVEGAEIYFGVSPGWDTTKEPADPPQKAACPHCGGGLGGLRFCPCCNGVSDSDQAKLDAQPHYAYPPDQELLASYADTVEIVHRRWQDVPTLDGAAENDCRKVARSLKAGKFVAPDAQVRRFGPEVLMTDLDAGQRDQVRRAGGVALLGSQKSPKGVGR